MSEMRWKCIDFDGYTLDLNNMYKMIAFEKDAEGDAKVE